MRFKPVTGAFEAFITSLSSMAPTFVMSFTVALAAQSAGAAVPLAFLAGGIAMAVVGWSFIAFSRRVVGAGSAMAYVDVAFGRRAAFLTGWTMLLAYVTLTVAAFVLVGTFAAQALSHDGLGTGRPVWAWVGAAAGLAAAWVASRRLATAAHLMLLLELASVLAILWLAIVILGREPLSTAPLRPDPAHGLAGIGGAMVFSILAFTGFETSTTLSEETRDATRSIPRALFAAIAIVAAFYLLIVYVQVLGFGVGNSAGLAATAAPLDVLATRYISGTYGVLLDVAAAISAFACTLGFTMATARILYALGAAGLDARLTALDARHAAPRRAIVVVAAAGLAILAAFGWAGSQPFTNAVLTVGTLALILVYMTVCVAQGVAAGQSRRPGLAIVGFAGALLLLWPLWASLYPPPPWPGGLWPLLILAWIAIGGVLLKLHPGLRVPAPASASALEISEQPGFRRRGAAS